MWEIFTCGEMPYREKRNIDVVEYVVTQNKRLNKPGNTPVIIYQVMMRCWEKVLFLCRGSKFFTGSSR